MWIEQNKGATVNIFLCLAKKSEFRSGGNKQSKDFSGMTSWKFPREEKTNENAQTLHQTQQRSKCRNDSDYGDDSMYEYNVRTYKMELDIDITFAIK